MYNDRMNNILCPFCEKEFDDVAIGGSVQCPRCHEFFNIGPAEPDDSTNTICTTKEMENLANEDYEHNLYDEGDGEFGE